MTDPSYALLQREASVARYTGMQAQTYQQVGKVLVVANAASNESTVLVKFPNPFTEEPVFTYGASLDSGQAPVSGSFPTVSAVVHQWTVATSGPTSLYGAALLGIVTTGLSTQRLWVHYSFLGTALSFGGADGSGAVSA